MKTRKNIRDVFKNDGKEAELETGAAVITSITQYPSELNDFYVYYTYSGPKRISFADGEEVVV